MEKYHFDPKKAFFIIDSDNLDQIKDEFYGFTILNSRIVKTLQELGSREPEGDGAYVLIRRSGDKITLEQDFMGSYGLYLYRKEGWFALSNSFMRLVEYLKTRQKMTLNVEYADFFVPADLCSVAYGETLVREISCLDRSARVEIDVKAKTFSTTLKDYFENTVALTSPEGMELLDGWFTKWTGLIRNIKAETNNIQTDLSGGFDSRLTFSLLLGAGVELSDMFVFSIQDQLHTHAEDFEIATAIAEHYDFRLNNSSMLTPGIAMEGPRDVLDISMYTKLGFHKQMYSQLRYFEKTRYNFVGNGGECIRDYWSLSAGEYIEEAVRRAKGWPKDMAPRMENAIRRILTASMEGIRKKFEGFGRPLSPEAMTLNLYRETRCRNHFGKAIVERFLANSITCAPLLDPMLHRLKTSDGVCGDKNLLMAIICTRFCPELMDFKFDNKRFIAPDTVGYAREINGRYPFRKPWRETVPPVEEERRGHVRSVTPEALTDIMLGVFRSREIKAHFTDLYGTPGYEKIAQDVQTRKFHPLQNAYAAIAIAWVSREIAIGRNILADSLGEGMCSLGSDFRKEAEESQTLRTHPAVKNFITARVDLKLDEGDVEVLEVSDALARVHTPGYMLSGGVGYVIESQKGNMKIRFRCVSGGKLHVNLRSLAVLDENKQRIPYFVDYTGAVLDGKAILAGRRPVSHDVPVKTELPVKPGQELVLEVAWVPHEEALCRMLDRYRPPKTN